MPVMLPEGKEHSPVSISVTYAQRAAMRAAVKNKKSPYKTYGAFVMAALRGDAPVLKPKGSVSRTVSVLLFITEGDEEILKKMAHEADASLSALVRNKVFGEEFPRRQDKYGRQIGFTITEDKLMVFRAVGDILEMKCSDHQLILWLALSKAADILNEEQQNKDFTDNTSDSVE